MTNKAVSSMQLKKYHVDKMLFELNKTFDFTKESSIAIHPVFDRQVVPIDSNKFVTTLSVKIDPELHKSPIPFYAEIKISGKFEFNDWKHDDRKTIAYNNSAAILFPYLRHLLSTMTMQGNMPPYTLPVMNINHLFNNNQ